MSYRRFSSSSWYVYLTTEYATTDTVLAVKGWSNSKLLTYQECQEVLGMSPEEQLEFAESLNSKVTEHETRDLLDALEEFVEDYKEHSSEEN